MRLKDSIYMVLTQLMFHFYTEVNAAKKYYNVDMFCFCSLTSKTQSKASKLDMLDAVSDAQQSKHGLPQCCHIS